MPKIVRQLYKDNYCLEKCKSCRELSDKYVEYESNLKILSVLLCFTQIHRHLFYNVQKISQIEIKAFSVSFLLLLLFYLHEAKVNYRKYLEQQFLNDVRDLKMKEFQSNMTATDGGSVTENDTLNVQSLDQSDET